MQGQLRASQLRGTQHISAECTCIFAIASRRLNSYRYEGLVAQKVSFFLYTTRKYGVLIKYSEIINLRLSLSVPCGSTVREVISLRRVKTDIIENNKTCKT